MSAQDKYTIEDMLRWGWIDEEDAERLRKAEREEDRRIKRINARK